MKAGILPAFFIPSPPLQHNSEILSRYYFRLPTGPNWSLAYPNASLLNSPKNSGV